MDEYHGYVCGCKRQQQPLCLLLREIGSKPLCRRPAPARSAMPPRTPLDGGNSWDDTVRAYEDALSELP